MKFHKTLPANGDYITQIPPQNPDAVILWTKNPLPNVGRITFKTARTIEPTNYYWVYRQQAIIYPQDLCCCYELLELHTEKDIPGFILIG